MKIFVDFDDVIFNAKRFKEDLIKIFRRNGVTRREFENSYYTFQKKAQTEGKHYDPKKQIKVLQRRDQIDQKKLELDIDRFMDDLGGYVFPDVYDFIKNFRKKDLYIISYGHEKHQLAKIKGSGIRRYFKKVVISKDNKINIIVETARKDRFLSQEDILLLDDRPEQLERVKKFKKNIRTFRICRPEGRYSDLICMDKDYEVRNLKEVIGIINKVGME